MLYGHSKYIQEGKAILFYRYSRELNGYMILGLLIGDGAPAKLQFVKVWEYFVSEVVKTDDIYCAVPGELNNSLFANYLTEHRVIDGLQIYKVDNRIKDKYSAFSRHLENRQIKG